MDANQNNDPTKKTYHKKATGKALETVEKHSQDHELKLFGSCFCPFVQRVWISLEMKGLDYQYIEGWERLPQACLHSINVVQAA
ncbi:hypothetical protein KCV05_g14320, partial [Aureobasidium melanogenum]